MTPYVTVAVELAMIMDCLYNCILYSIYVTPYVTVAVELAMIMDRLYGGVCYAGIDTDPELKYPKV